VQVVITEAELKRFTDVGELLIPDNAVVTPTAWDYARNHGICLVREGEPRKGRPVRKCYCQDTGGVPTQDDIHRTIRRILKVAVARLGASVEPEILATIVIKTLTRLGYDVVMSKGGEPG
jgi:hypothetical protein